MKFCIGELVHRRVLEHCDQPVHDHTSNLGHLQIPPGDSKKGKYFSQHPMKSLQRGLETRYLVSFLALLLVGIGSTMFHMTLQ